MSKTKCHVRFIDLLRLVKREIDRYFYRERRRERKERKKGREKIENERQGIGKLRD